MRLGDKLREKVASFNQSKEDLAAALAAEKQRECRERVQKLLELAKRQYPSLVSKAAEEGKSLCTLTTFSYFDTETMLSLLPDLATALESDGIQLLITGLFEVQRYFRGVTLPVGRIYHGGWNNNYYYIEFQDGSKLKIDGHRDMTLTAKW